MSRSPSPDLHVWEEPDPLNQEIKRNSSVSEVEHGIYSSSEECHHAILINFLQSITTEQWMMLKDGVFDHLGPELTQVCSKIVQFVSHSVTKSVLPGLYQILDIKKEVESSTLPWKPRASSVSSLDMSHVATVSQAAMASGSGQSSPRSHIQGSSPSSTHVDKEPGLQHSPQLKHRRMDHPVESRKNGSQVSTPSPRTPASRFEDQSSNPNSSDALKILLGVPEDCLFKSLKGNLLQSMKEIAEKLYSRSNTSGSQTPSPAMMEEAAKKVISSVSLVCQSASSKQTPVPRSGKRGKSLSTLTKKLKKKMTETNQPSFSAAPLESENKVPRESCRLTRDVMVTISDIIVASGDKRDAILLDSLSAKLKILASNYNTAKVLASQNKGSLIRRRTNSQSSISETRSVDRSRSKPMMKLWSREFELSAKETASEILMRKASALLPSSQSAESVAECAHHVEAAASAVVETFVTCMEHLNAFARHQNPSTCEQTVWSTVFQVFKRIEHKLEAFFIPLTRQSPCNAAADDQSTLIESRETVLLPPQAKTESGSKSNSMFQQSSEEVTPLGGLHDSSRPPWTEKNPLEQKLLLTACTKEVIAELLLLCDTDVSNEYHSSAKEGKVLNKSHERQGFIWEVLSKLEKISLGKPSGIHDDLSVPDRDTRSPSCATLSSQPVQSLFRAEFQAAATRAVSELLVKFNDEASTPAAFNSDGNQSIDHSTSTKDTSSFPSLFTDAQSADGAASGIVEIFVEDLQRMAQPREGQQRDSGVLENIQRLQSRIRSAASLLYHGIQERIKAFSLPQQRLHIQKEQSTTSLEPSSACDETDKSVIQSRQCATPVNEREANLQCRTGTAPLDNSESGFGPTGTDERAQQFATKTREVISTILTSCKDKTATDSCSSSLRKSRSDESLAVSLFVSGVLTQLDDMCHSPKTASPFEDLLPEDALEPASPLMEQGDNIPIEDIAHFLYLSNGSLERLQSPEFHTQAVEDVRGLLNSSPLTARDEWTGSDNDTLSTGGGDYTTVQPIRLDVNCPTSSLAADTASEIIKSVANDFEELTQPIESSCSLGQTTAQVSEKHIWDVAFNMYHHVQSKVKEFLILQSSNQCITVPLQSRKHEETAQGSIHLNGGIASSRAASFCQLEHEQIRCKSTAKDTSIKLRPEQASMLPIPGTPIPTDLPVPVGHTIIRSTIIDESLGTEDTLPGNLLIQVRLAASAVADEMLESAKPTNKEDGRDIPHPRRLRYAVRKLQKMMSAEVLRDFTCKFLEIVSDLVRDGKGLPLIFKLGKKTLDSTLLWLQWRDRTCATSNSLCARVLPIFAEELLKMIMKHFCRQLSKRSSRRLNKKTHASDLVGPSTSACRVIPTRIDSSSSLDYDDTLDQMTNVMKREMMDAISVSSADMSSSKAFNRAAASRTSMATRKIVQGVLTLVDLSIGADDFVNHSGNTGRSLACMSASSEVPHSEDYHSLVLSMSLKLLTEICPHASQREEMSRDVTMLVLSDFYAASGLSGMHAYPPDLKIHRIFQNVYKKLLLTFGTKDVLRAAVNIQDPYFISIMAKCLTNELLNTCGIAQSPNVTGVASTGDPESGDVKNETHSTATTRKTRKWKSYSRLKKWFNRKLNSKEEVEMNGPPQILENQHQPAFSIPTDRDGAPFTSIKESTKRSSLVTRMVGAITKALRSSA